MQAGWDGGHAGRRIGRRVGGALAVGEEGVAIAQAGCRVTRGLCLGGAGGGRDFYADVMQVVVLAPRGLLGRQMRRTRQRGGGGAATQLWTGGGGHERQQRKGVRQRRHLQ